MRWLRLKKLGQRPRALFLIIGLLVSSALLRLGGDAGQALARAVEAVEPAAEASQVVNEGADCKTPAELRGMIEAFEQREARLSEREAALENRLIALRVADEDVSAKLAALEQAESDLRETIALADTAAENDIDRLTRVYENMKPKQAAALFEEMDPNFAAGFLGRMRPEAAAEIMAGLSPEAAHLFSVVLAGRNAEVPSE